MAAVLPNNESGPCTLKISNNSPVDADDENIFTRDNGNNSVGKISSGINADNKAPSIFKKPDARNTPTATISPIKVGKIPSTVLNPSFAPSIKSSYTGR